ncbi:hypothetical protein NBM05_08475 [Rothia sp. AR01]|uniref:Uncharacterized protein n=1 Tax=Rothia santali TaxID=2949643 RepID=A0A9X2HB17_9MICC|nr:hypothetical protein [Rothia santali]MCP3426036.1 hypothetical protein [Rothia santali]
MTRTLRQIRTLVTLRGQDRGLHPVSWSAALTNDLPGRFTSSDSVPQRTGTIRWDHDQEGTISRDVSPLDPDYPRPGDPVVCTAQIRQGEEVTAQRVFTGVVDETSGGMGEPLVSTLIDRSDDLNASVSWYPLIHRMPRRQRTQWRSPYPGTQYVYVLAEAAKQCGFGARYPAFDGDWLLNAHLNGSVWTDFLRYEGGLVAAGVTEDPSGPPVFAALRGRRGLQRGVAAWDNDPRSVLPHGLFIDVELLGCQAGTYLYLGVRFNDSTTVQLGVVDGGLHIYTSTGRHIRVADLAPGDHLLGLYYPPGTGQRLWARIDGQFHETPLTRLDADREIIGTGADTYQTPTTAPIFLYKTGPGIACEAMIGRPGQDQATPRAWQAICRSRTGHAVNWRLDAQIPGTGYIPGMETETGKDAIATVAGPYCISSWVDGAGILQFWSGNLLRAQAPALRLTESDYAPLRWSTAYTHAAGQVTGKFRDRLISMNGSGNPVVEVWTGSSSDTFDADRRLTYIVRIGDSEDFFEVDTKPVNLNEKFDAIKDAIGERLRLGRLEKWWWGWRSVFAVARTDKNETGSRPYPLDAVPGGLIQCEVERISIKTFKVTVGWAGTGGWARDSRPQMPQQINESLGFNMNNQGMPVLRAGGGVEVFDATSLAFPTGGPAGPELIHDMGVWGSGGAVRHVCRVLAEYFATEHPVFEDVTTSFDPRIDVGLVLTLEATKRWGHAFTVLVTGVEHDPVAGTTTFTPRVVSFRRTSRTYGEVERDFASYRELEGVGTYRALTG